MALALMGGCALLPAPGPFPRQSPSASPTASPATAAPALSYRELAEASVDTLLHGFYHNAGWRPCPLPDCRAVNRDWGVDSLTYTLYLRWQTTHDAALVPYMRALASTAPLYPAPCHGIGGLLCTWSDAPQWDVVAALREYEVTGKHTVALDRAIRAFDTVEVSDVYTGGGCRDIRYQQPFGYLDRLKTLETEATAVKAALLLYRFTSSKRYLDIAIARYARARRYYLDPTVPLYTVFVFDFDGKCRQVPRRFFASVNGEMISNGLALFYFTGNRVYRRQALATAAAVADRLNDARGIFADLQADNDIVEPLVEAMYELASREQLDFARSWLLRNAAAAASARKPDGTYGRFFDGPPPPGTVTAWQTNGAFALMIVAAALEPDASPPPAAWTHAQVVRHPVLVPSGTLRFTAAGIALIGTLGDPFLQPGHARVFVDGVETFDRSGIWQGSSSALRRLPGSILFSWQWPATKAHTLEFRPAAFNLKEGGAYLHVTSYLLK